MTNIQTEVLQLKATAKAAQACSFLPASTSAAIGQACKVIDLLAGEVDELRADLARHFHLRAAAVSVLAER